MARVLWIGDAGSHTGFGRVTHEIAGALARRGHDISVLGLNYVGDYDPSLDGLKVYRANAADPGDNFGARRVRDLFERIDPEVTVILHDPAAVWQYLLTNPYDGQILLTRPSISYCPVDGYDYPSEWVELLPRMTNFVAMSQHGQRTFRPSALVYHGVDTEWFHPVSADSPIDLDGPRLTTKRECKQALGFDPDRFLILRVDTNSGRKDYASTVKAVAPFLETHRDAAMHLHAITDPRMPGVNLKVMLSRYDLEDGQVTAPDLFGVHGWSEERLRILYNAADVFISTSRGEGFGLTIAEALACGVPVIAQNTAAIPEIVGPGGILIEPERAITVPAGQDLRLANINAFTEAVEHLYTNVAYRLDLGRAGRKHVAESFRWDIAVDRFHDFIEAAAARWRQSQEATTDGPE